MAVNIRAKIELIPSAACKDVERLDAKEISNDPQKYIEDNLLSYYVIINMWLMSIQQWSRYGWVYVLDHMKQNGLLATIRRFDEVAGQIIREEPIDFGVARQIYRDVLSSGPIVGTPQDPDVSILSDSKAAMLYLCRFPKRFSPLRADKLRMASLDNFEAEQRRLKILQRQSFPRIIVNAVRKEISQLLDWESLISELKSVDVSDIVFTPGVSFDTTAPLLSKLQSIAKSHVEYFPIPFGIPVVAHREYEGVEWFEGKCSSYEIHSVRLIAVPKNYKTARVIAPEDVYRQALARRYFIISDRYLPGEIRLHDQTQNQQLALQGSIDGSLATIDLHAASDSVTRTHLYELLPLEFVAVLEKVLPTHFVRDGKRKRLESAATMGNSMTFWIESVVFCGIAKAALRYTKLFNSDCGNIVSVYGDDIIISTEAATLCVEWLESLGFVVNSDKSFIDPDLHYRESCGEEYLDGRSLTSRYFPRFPLEGTIGGKFSTRLYRDSFRGVSIDTMTAILDLQHKAFTLCEPASRLLTELVREADPRMTTSLPDEGLSDLWSYESTPKIIPAPAAEIVDGKLKKTVVEGMVREAHLAPITTYPKPTADTDEILVSLYNYQSFLKYGPRYEDPLMELLGISSPPLDYAEASSHSVIKWAYIK